MSAQHFDLAIVGGGLAGGLTALAVHRANPDLSIALVEAGDSLGGNHRWSWFTTDLGEDGDALLAPFPRAELPGGNEVRFPGHRRVLSASYRSLSSADFDATLRRLLPQSAIRTGWRVDELSRGALTLSSGEEVPADRIIDCRDFAPSADLSGGWQVFMGRHIKLPAPHGLTRPIIMDAAVEQHGAYRFVYTLPLSRDELFIEDTYYADEPTLDRDALSDRVDAYAAANGWEGETIGSETGVLPVITHGNAAAHRARLAVPGVALAGARGLFTHPLTSYTVPIAVRNAIAIARNIHLGADDLAALVEGRALAHWRSTNFYRLLGRMLFDAAEPDERYRVFERFYRLPEPLIERFYAASSTLADKARILSGKPPVPVGKAIKALLGKGKPLVQGKRL